MTDRPLLEIVTRHLPGREAWLQRQQQSLRKLGTGWVQTLLLDPDHLGIAASHVRLRSFEPRAHFCWVLDDDDICMSQNLMQVLNPSAGVDLYVFRIFYDEYDDVYPFDHFWKARTLERANAHSSNLVLSRDLWLSARHAWGEQYDGDFDFIEAALRLAKNTLWVDQLVAEVTEPHQGAVPAR